MDILDQIKKILQEEFKNDLPLFHWKNVEKAIEFNFAYPWSLLPEEIRKTFMLMHQNNCLVINSEQREKLAATNIPKKYLVTKVDLGNEPDLINKCLPFVHIEGESSFGKTERVCKFVKKFYNQYNIYYINAVVYQEECESFSLDYARADYIKRCEILIIDELCGELVRTKNHVFPLLKYRYDNGYKTITITNTEEVLLHKYPFWQYLIELKKIKHLVIKGPK
jgi:hypothetical protein